jgi:hypothetical protein
MTARLRRIARGGRLLSPGPTSARSGGLPAGGRADRGQDLENHRLVGQIRLALPNARIIHVRCDPLDTCVSCFSLLFVNVPYSYDLTELGRMYRAYASLMERWRQVVPESGLLEVRYEELVDYLEGQARRIVGHCGLEWDVRCLQFPETDRRGLTASASQVRPARLPQFGGPLALLCRPPVALDRGARPGAGVVAAALAALDPCAHSGLNRVQIRLNWAIPIAIDPQAIRAGRRR